MKILKCLIISLALSAPSFAQTTQKDVLTDLEIVRAYEADNDVVVLVIRVCNKEFQIGIPKFKMNDPDTAEKILAYLEAECTN